MDRPETRFASRDESALACQTFGEGSPALLYLQGWVSNVEHELKGVSGKWELYRVD